MQWRGGPRSDPGPLALGNSGKRLESPPPELVYFASHPSSGAPHLRAETLSCVDVLTKPDTRLLVVVINDPERVDDVLTGFLELGITGATVINSEGMGRILPHQIPIFAGLRAVVGDDRPKNVTIFSVVAKDVVHSAIELVKAVCGDLDAPSTGIAFVLPLDHVAGLAPGLERARDAGEVPPGGRG